MNIFYVKIKHHLADNYTEQNKNLSVCLDMLVKNKPRNAVYLGNEIFAEVELISDFDEYHIKKGDENNLCVKIRENIVTWLIPKCVFGEGNHVKFDFIFKFKMFVGIKKVTTRKIYIWINC